MEQPFYCAYIESANALSDYNYLHSTNNEGDNYGMTKTTVKASKDL